MAKKRGRGGLTSARMGYRAARLYQTKSWNRGMRSVPKAMGTYSSSTMKTAKAVRRLKLSRILVREHWRRRR